MYIHASTLLVFYSITHVYIHTFEHIVGVTLYEVDTLNVVQVT